MKRSLLGLLVLLVVIAAGMIAWSRFFADYPAAQATLLAQIGTATITRKAGTQDIVQEGKQAQIGDGDTLQIDGSTLIGFAGAQTALGPGAQVELVHYGMAGNEAQIDLRLKTGQVYQHVTGYNNDRSRYTLTSDAGTLTTRNGDFVMWTDDKGLTQLGVIAGSVSVSGQGKSVTVAQDQGVVLMPGQAPGEITPWSRVRVTTYRPDGSTVLEPVSLTNSKTKIRYDFVSQGIVAVPEGTYRLSVDALESYQQENLTLASGTLSELPVTLSEIIFTTTDVAGNGVPYTALTVQGTNKARALPNTPVLLSPGEWTVIVAREDNPNAIQPVNVNLAPGQRINVSLRGNLFGGGKLDVHVLGTDGNPAAPVKVNIYQAGAEAGQPLVSFKSDGAPQPLPEGNYVVSVLTSVADRIEVSIQQNKDAAVQTKLGTIVVNYTDSQGRPISGRLAYIARAEAMQVLGVALLQMPQTPYGIAVPTGTSVVVPAGRYNVLVDDSKDVGQQNVVVEPGKTATVDLKVGQ